MRAGGIVMRADPTIVSLEGTVVRLRALDPGDVEAAMPWRLQDDLFLDFWRDRPGRTLQDVLLDLHVRSEALDQVPFAIERRDDRAMIGEADLYRWNKRRRDVECGIVIWRPEDRGRGAGRDALRLLCRYAFGALGVRRVHLHTAERNQAARRSFGAAGFRQTGKTREGQSYFFELVRDIEMAIDREEFLARDRTSGTSEAGPA